MMIGVGVDKCKQRNMCYLNVTNMEKSEEDGGEIKLKDDMHEYKMQWKGAMWKVIK